VVWSKLDSGTEVELSIPSSTAFATSYPPRSWLSEKFLPNGQMERNRWERDKDKVMSADDNSIRILAVDDHSLIREGIATFR